MLTWRLGRTRGGTRARRLPVPHRTHALAFGLILLTIILAPSATSQPRATDMLAELYLTGYTPGTKPPEFASGTIEGPKVSLAGLRGRVSF
jgi:hypothetical protein